MGFWASRGSRRSRKLGRGSSGGQHDGFTMTGLFHFTYKVKWCVPAICFMSFCKKYVGLFSPVGTWVGGTFVMAIAIVYNPTKGLIWALIPLQMSVSFIIGESLCSTGVCILCETACLEEV